MVYEQEFVFQGQTVTLTISLDDLVSAVKVAFQKEHKLPLEMNR